mmetsp:Transcript_18145/g.45735  ORF Transcript_18145/g.45735 Transcript_18145/m.45735 type:complete len:498 (+) Transcript_18145:2766-4259(+)
MAVCAARLSSAPRQSAPGLPANTVRCVTWRALSSTSGSVVERGMLSARLFNDAPHAPSTALKFAVSDLNESSCRQVRPCAARAASGAASISSLAVSFRERRLLSCVAAPSSCVSAAPLALPRASHSTSSSVAGSVRTAPSQASRSLPAGSDQCRDSTRSLGHAVPMARSTPGVHDTLLKQWCRRQCRCRRVRRWYDTQPSFMMAALTEAAASAMPSPSAPPLLRGSEPETTRSTPLTYVLRASRPATAPSACALSLSAASGCAVERREGAALAPRGGDVAQPRLQARMRGKQGRQPRCAASVLVRRLAGAMAVGLLSLAEPPNSARRLGCSCTDTASGFAMAADACCTSLAAAAAAAGTLVVVAAAGAGRSLGSITQVMVSGSMSSASARSSLHVARSCARDQGPRCGQMCFAMTVGGSASRDVSSSASAPQPQHWMSKFGETSRDLDLRKSMIPLPDASSLDLLFLVGGLGLLFSFQGSSLIGALTPPLSAGMTLV